MYYFEPSYVINGGDPIAKVKQIIAIQYIAGLKEALLDGSIKPLCVQFLKTQKDEVNIRWFRQALEEVAPELIDWFNKIEALK